MRQRYRLYVLECLSEPKNLFVAWIYFCKHTNTSCLLYLSLDFIHELKYPMRLFIARASNRKTRD